MGRERGSAVIRYETNFMPTALAMARAGLGVAILPESAAGQNTAGLVRIAFNKPALHRQICLLERRDRSLSPSAAAFVECLRASGARAVANGKMNAAGGSFRSRGEK